MKIAVLVIVATLFISQLCFAFSSDDGEFQYWNTESINLKINEDWKFYIEEEFRLGDDTGNLYYQHSDLGLIYAAIDDWLDLGFNYRHVFEKKSGDKWREERRPHLNATLKGKLLDFALSNRFRFEYRNREAADNYWRYRNKLAIKFPFQVTKFAIQPYLANELFIDFDAEKLNRNRLYAGFSFKLFKNLKGDLFYLWQDSKSSGKWTQINVLGTKLKLYF